MAEILRDIIDIPEIKPVIELDNADTIPDAITSSFVLTQEVEEGLRVILARVNADFVQKPIAPDEFLSKVREILDRKAT